MLKESPWVKRWVEAGEEQVGRLAQQLLSNEKFVAAVQGLVTRSLAARDTVDKSLRAALSAMNLPTAAEVDSLRTKVGDLETLLGGVEKKVDALLKRSKSP
ncbi:MAG TPA: hypothetical protein VEY30_13020 [Myxococcaceae bacterium]|nr:hypothetical protein [Myxococcaceae bacterium]